MKRAFVHLAPTAVRSHAAADPACNVLQLKVNFSKRYWDPADEGAPEMWAHVKEWLAGKRYFVGENIKGFNKSRGERGEQTVDYRRIDLLMAGNTLHVAVEPGCELPAFEDMAERLRDLMAQGAIGRAPAEVFAPSDASLARQRDAWRKACEDAAAGQREGAASGQVEPAADERPTGAPEPEPEGREASGREAPAAAPMAVDYGVWGVVEGSSQREFDPARGAWL